MSINKATSVSNSFSFRLAAALLGAAAACNAAPASAQMGGISGIDPAVLAAIAQSAQSSSSSSTVGSGPTDIPTLPTVGPSTISGANQLPDQALPSASTATPGPGVAADYARNQASKVFGAQLFTGAFASPASAQYNPNYMVNVGDHIHVRMWGAYEFNQYLIVDPQGNIFLPNVGPVHILGTRNDDLQSAMRTAIGRSFRSNVQSYTTLAEAQPVRVFVTGFVNRPGLYNGTSLDSLLHYLDLAGGIDPDRGSFISVQIKRGEQVRVRANLYEFLLRGVIPQVQLDDGDVIFVGPRQHTFTVQGLAENPNIFEFPANASISTADVALLARPLAAATHMRVTRNTGPIKNVEYYALGNAQTYDIQNGDVVEFTADKKPGTITVRVEGEHQSGDEYVLPYGSRFGDLISQVKFTDRSDVDNIQLFRQSVKDRQKVMLETSLNSLQMAALNARSGTAEVAQLRKTESEMILQWVSKARSIEPIGQVVLGHESKRDDFLLENGDVFRIPAKDGIVLISGEVLFPNAVAWSRESSVDDYVRAAGGFAQRSGARRVVVAHRDGSFDEVSTSAKGIKPGDDLLILPRVDTKSRQIFKDMTQILYQIAVSARVVLGL
jgi:protein involved in polysaccharide export with SLBB domain